MLPTEMKSTAEEAEAAVSLVVFVAQVLTGLW